MKIVCIQSFYLLLTLKEIVFIYSRATLDSLGGEYEVEAGYGSTRDSYLRDNAIDTFFIIPPAHRRKVSANIMRISRHTEKERFIVCRRNSIYHSRKSTIGNGRHWPNEMSNN